MAGSIKKDIRDTVKSKVYLIWGDEEFLRDYYKNALIQKVLDKDFADFNFKQYTTKKPVYDEIESFFASYPCMSDKKVIYIKDSGIFKKATEEDKKFWSKFLNELPDFAILIFSEKSVDKRNALYKLINSDFACDEFAFQKRPELTSWIIRYFAKYEKNITDENAGYLIDCCSESMYILKSEIEKLANFKQKAKIITKDDIDICSCKVPESRVFKMIDDILDKNLKGAGEKLAQLKLLKEEPIALAAAVFTKYSQLRKMKLLSKSFSPKEIAFKTGQKDFIVNLNLNKIKNIPIEKLDSILMACQNLDYRIKSGLSDGWTEFELLFAAMCE